MPRAAAQMLDAGDAGPAPRRRTPLPENLPPRGLSREQAAAYVGVSPTTFDRMVSDGMMPAPNRIYGRVVWDVRKLDRAFDALDSEGAPESPWERQRA